MMLISIHIPKTAGSSFVESLNNIYKEKILLDYNDRPMHKPVYLRHCNVVRDSILSPFRSYDGVDIIHGHFLALKYRFFSIREKTSYIVWMRDPIERLASHFYYFKRTYNSEDKKNPLRNRVVEEEWSLEKFCLSNEFKDTYNQFFWGFPLDNFNFIGIVENYDDEIEYFSRVVLNQDKSLPTYNLLENPSYSKAELYFSKKSKLKQKIEIFHSKDMELYGKALWLKKHNRK